MIRRRFVCRNCGYRFDADVLEEGEAEEKRMRPARLRCPKCNSAEIDRA